LFVNDRVDTNETATSVLELQSQTHTASSDAIAEEDEGTETSDTAAAASTPVTQSTNFDTVLCEFCTLIMLPADAAVVCSVFCKHRNDINQELALVLIFILFLLL